MSQIIAKLETALNIELRGIVGLKAVMALVVGGFTTISFYGLFSDAPVFIKLTIMFGIPAMLIVFFFVLLNREPRKRKVVPRRSYKRKASNS